MIPVFVYGTLKSGNRNHRLLECDGCSKVHYVAKVNGHLFDTPYGYPTMSLLEGVSEEVGLESSVPRYNEHFFTVSGELYYVSSELLNRLDVLEGYNPSNLTDSLYHRVVVSVFLPSSNTCINAYVYVGNLVPATSVVADGNWTPSTRSYSSVIHFSNN